MKRVAGMMLAAALAVFGQLPRIDNTQVETRAIAGNLDATMRNIVAAQTAPAWIGYGVPIVPGERQVCGWDRGVQRSNHLSLEGSTALNLLFRVEQKRIVKLRMATPDCEIDAGGLPVIWLTGVKPAESVRFIESLIAGNDGNKEQEHIADSAVSSIALHNDPAADAVLDQLLRPSQSESLRRKAVFWLGVARGRHGYEKLIEIIKSDPSDKVREHAIFALTQSKDKDAIPAIVKVAHEDKSPRVRGQALFWLAQTAQKKVAAEAIANAIDSDPETEVKKKAVFALSQLPAGDGVPKLIEVAKMNRNPAVRKQALFWLGQSKDPRALSFIEELLTR